MSMFGVRFSFVATRSGLTRVRHHNADDLAVKREALAFAKRHARAMDETYFQRTVDYNMLMNDTATLLQVPFNMHQKILDRLSKFELDSVAPASSNYDGIVSSQPDMLGETAVATGAPLSTSDELADSDSLDATSAGGGSSFSTKLSIKDMDLFERLELLANSSLHVIATESLIVNEGAQRAVAGVSGVFYDYATFVMRFLNSTNAKYSGSNDQGSYKKSAKCYLAGPDNQEACEEEAPPSIKCGHLNDTIDCLLVDNNGYILVSERLEFVGRHLKAYDEAIMRRLVANGVYHEVNITDHQSICLKQEEKQTTPSASSAAAQVAHLFTSSASSMLANLLTSLRHIWIVVLTVGGFLVELGQTALVAPSSSPYQSSSSSSALMLESQQRQSFQAMSALLPKKSYLRPCDRVLTRYETRPGQPLGSERPEHYSTRCNCPGWFVYEQVPMTNLILLIVDSASSSACRGDPAGKCQADNPALMAVPSKDHFLEDDSLMSQSNIIGQDEGQICSMFERDQKLHKRQLDSCISHHQDEEQIKLCGSASRPAGLLLEPLSSFLWSLSLFLLFRLMFSF